MSNSQSINWPRLFAEGAAIVISILLAFAVQAWWESVGEERQELEALIGLKEEFETNIETSMDAKSRLQLELGSTRGLTESTGPQTDDERKNSAVEFLSQLLNSFTALRYAEGTLSSLLNNQGLNIISNAELRRQLASWPGASSIVYERQQRQSFIMREHLMPYLWARIPVKTLDAMVNNELENSEFELDIDALLTDLQFENLVNEIYYATNEMLRRMDEAEQLAQQILTLVESEIARLENE